jgi:hypothetical protein
MPSRWQTVVPNKASRIPYGNCVYVLIHNGAVQYVGQTASLYGRIHQHAKALGLSFREGGVVVKYSFNRRYGEHAMREIRLIGALNPPQNKAHRRNMNLCKWFPSSP